MAYKLITSPQTENDIEQAVEYYLDIRTELAKQFLTELKAVKKYIHKNPEKIQIRYKNVRVAFLKKFPYGIHFTFSQNTITIIAVFATADNPDKWNARRS